MRPGRATPVKEKRCALLVAVNPSGPPTVQLKVLIVVAIRFGGELDMIPSALFSSLLSMVVTAPLANMTSVPADDLGYLAVFGVTQLGLGLLFLTEGSRRISPPSVALIGSLGIPFAMLWVWLWFSESSNSTASTPPRSARA